MQRPASKSRTTTGHVYSIPGIGVDPYIKLVPYCHARAWRWNDGDVYRYARGARTGQGKEHDPELVYSLRQSLSSPLD